MTMSQSPFLTPVSVYLKKIYPLFLMISLVENLIRQLKEVTGWV